ncbi:MAG: 4-hydroxy-tetrahydrodipicolinate reductase [Paludibacteraceae bacterium]|nr:4-hydroxy-tetrahydrodipicolinate reductase [Paludibacteraceae bacterium]
MKIALIGYGKMGQLIEKIALQRGHTIVAKVDVDNMGDIQTDAFRSADVAIEFTTPQSAVNNYRAAWREGVKVVSGTTGWTLQMNEIRQEVEANGHTLFWASNFSVGVNVFIAANRRLAELMNRFPQYDVRLSETHHTAKKDAPSGTAITLAEAVMDNLDAKDTWVLGDAKEPNQMGIEAIRKGEVPGIHTVIYDSNADTITFTHSAKSREGFALGAVLAAEYTAEHSGWLTMNDMFGF